ncbi:protein hinderin isoform X2 [Cynoglossus semilaevis]|uniref:protein hinderin isoform X2 n=1 Tax=Cynoglossus semilaevis TaxID=244447 RepID=UPI0007DCA85F|nr:protein hinderin isoform X2 [Cynoglossus semilaevis]
MAAKKTKSGSSGIFWVNGDEEQPFVFVPGVNGEVFSHIPVSLESDSTFTVSNRGAKIQGAAGHRSDCKKESASKKGGKKQGHTQSNGAGFYTKENLSVHQRAALLPENSPSLVTFLPQAQVISDTSVKSQISLKDLCSEDKRRIANLIEELARVSEEKEKSVKRLKYEQENFECKIQQLEQQNVIIMNERESLQQQYKECQELLGLYQKYLSQQQAKLNDTITQLSQTQVHNKVFNSDVAYSSASSTRANGLLHDGSYLSFAPQVHQPQVHTNGAAQAARNPGPMPFVSEIRPRDGSIEQHGFQKEEHKGPHIEACYRCYHCHSSGDHSSYRTKQQCYHKGCCQINDHLNVSDASKPHYSERVQSGAAVRSDGTEALTSPLLGHGDWEVKRHQLLMQKMQLEMERERLQARLEEQEERLNRQNQQLRQTRLDYSRSQQAPSQAELSLSNMRNGDPQLEQPPYQDLPSSVTEEVPASVDKSQPTCEQTTKDIATSPLKSPESLSKHRSTSAVPKTPTARSDFSLVELLDILSPVSVREQSIPSHQKTKVTQSRLALTTPKPGGRNLLTSTRRKPQTTEQDLEESQILEDIFFIC